MKSLTWTNEKRRLRDLIAWKFNPRQISKEQGARLLESLTTFGQFQTIAITPATRLSEQNDRAY